VLRAYAEGRIYGQTYGDDPVQVVWLHGWGRSSADFAASAVSLARGGTSSVALDLPGFGSSPLPTSAGGAVEYARLLAPVLDEIGASPLVLVGHSFGGRVAAVLAAQHPAQVAGLVLCGAPLVRRESSSRSPRAYRAVRALHRLGLISEARMEAARQKYGSSDYRAARGVLRDVLVMSVNENIEDELARIGAPVILVWGDQDLDVPVTVAQRARVLMMRSSDVALDVLSNTGHLVPTERPDVLMATVQRLVARL
jgi:pimeloyl-ACP methyl ester carboxylesterase